MDVKNNDVVDEVTVKKHPIGFRHFQILLLFLALVQAFMLRNNLSMAIVAMTDSTQEDSFDWTIQEQSTVLSAFLWGCVVTQFPGGELAARLGGKALVATCIISNVVVSVFIPLAAYYGGWQLLCAFRVLQGFGQGVLMPSLHNLIGKWAPLEEKSRLGSFVYSGAQFGIALQNLISGYIIDGWGWEAIFYVNAVIGAVWSVIFLIFGSDSPQSSRWIGENERLYIQTSLGQIGGHKKLKTPWKAIWTSMAFISLIVANCAQNWGLWTLMTMIPSYLSQVQGVNIRQNGLMSAIPYLAVFLMSFPVGYIADLIIRKKWLSLTVTRKIFNSIGFFGPGFTLIALSYAPADVTVAVALLTVVVALNAGHLSGYMLGAVDMAPNFAGTMSGITNGTANLLSIVAPLAAGLILQDETNPDEWRIVFYLSSAIYICCNIFYLIFGSSERQAWNEPETDANETIVEKL